MFDIKTNITKDLYNYAINSSIKEHPVLKKLRMETSKLATSKMQISVDEGQFIGLLAKIINAKKYLEIGVYTGYSSLVMALSMGKTGKIIGLDNNKDFINIAKSFWIEANVDKQIDIMLDDALISLEKLVNDNQENTFDIAFIDANKNDYLEYYEYCYKLVRPGGLILLDNVLMQGLVIDKNPPNFVKAIKDFNQFIYNDKRVEISLLPFADGLTIALKKDLSSWCVESGEKTV